MRPDVITASETNAHVCNFKNQRLFRRNRNAFNLHGTFALCFKNHNRLFRPALPLLTLASCAPLFNVVSGAEIPGRALALLGTTLKRGAQEGKVWSPWKKTVYFVRPRYPETPQCLLPLTGMRVVGGWKNANALSSLREVRKVRIAKAQKITKNEIDKTDKENWKLTVGCV